MDIKTTANAFHETILLSLLPNYQIQQIGREKRQEADDRWDLSAGAQAETTLNST